MNIVFAMEYIPQRMQELGFDKDYLLRYRHIFISMREPTQLNTEQSIFFFIGPEFSQLTIQSPKGIFDLNDYAINEQQHEHTGKIEITNNTGQNLFLVFLEAIPKNSI
jgi:hypothetical protein